jgi:hypothetical protein
MVAGRPSIEIAASGRESVAKTVEDVRNVPTGRKCRGRRRMYRA